MKPRLGSAAHWLSVLLLASALVLQPGCGGGSGDETVNPPVFLGTSFVSMGAPVQGAALSYVYPAAGATIPLATTNANGMASSPQMAQLQASRSFRLEASGGRVGGAALNGTMKAEIRNHRGAPIHVNPVTTLVSAHMKARPDATLEQAEDEVRRFLQLPPHQGLGVGLQGSTPEFSWGKFAAEMNAAPSFDAYMDGLLAEMHASPSSTHSFAEPLLRSGAAATIGIALATGALQEVGGVAMSKALAKMGIDDGTPDYAGQLSAIQDSLKQLQAGLAALDEKSNAILNAIQVGNYNAGTYSVNDLITIVQNQTAVLDTLIHLTPADYDTPNNKAHYDALRAEYFNAACRLYNNEFGRAADTIDTLLQGKIAGATPLITAFGKAQTSGKYIFTWEDSERYSSVRTYWESMHAALYNMIDIYLAIGTSPADLCNSTAGSARIIANSADPSDALTKERREFANIFLGRLHAQRQLYPRHLLPWGSAVYMDRNLMISLAEQQEPRYLPAHMVAHGYYPGYKSYSSNDKKGWNYANKVMNSAESVIPPTPQLPWPALEDPASAGTAAAINLRHGWRLPSEGEISDIFKGYYDGAEARGLPVSLMILQTGPAMIDAGVDSSGCLFWAPFSGCMFFGATFDVGSKKADPVSHADQQVLVFPVRKLTSAEDYFRR